MSDGHHPMCSKLRPAPYCGCWVRAAVAKTAHELGGYSVQNQLQIIAGDYSSVSPEDRQIFEQAIAAARGNNSYRQR